jgi:SAM-dependent methyltransferase
MFDQAARFTGDAIPTYYDSGLGPHLFADYAADLARRAAAAQPDRVLEIAAGTGIVTRLLRDTLPRSARLVASDLNLSMLKIARQKFDVADSVEFEPADAAALPFADGTFDTIVCQFGVMFFPDKEKAYHEAFRVLAAGGRYHFNVWDSFDFNAFARITHETVGRFFAEEAPTFFTVPFGYHRIDPIKASLIAAGFGDIAADVVRIEKAITDVRSFAHGLILGNPIAAEIEARGGAQPAAIMAALAEALQREFGQDSGCATMQAIVFAARKP